MACGTFQVSAQVLCLCPEQENQNEETEVLERREARGRGGKRCEDKSIVRNGDRNWEAEGAGRGEEEKACLRRKPSSTAGVWNPEKSHWSTQIRTHQQKDKHCFCPKKQRSRRADSYLLGPAISIPNHVTKKGTLEQPDYCYCSNTS